MENDKEGDEEQETSGELQVTDTDLEEEHEEPQDIDEKIEEEEAENDENQDKCLLTPGSGPKFTEAIEQNRQVSTCDKVDLEPEISCNELKDVEIIPPPSTVKCSFKEEWKNPSQSEMHYYLSTLRLAVPRMSKEQDKMKLRRWIFYLLRHVPDKTLRNRYLLLVTISALSDECMDMLTEEPPPSQICLPPLPLPCKTKPARWESDLYWDRLAADVPSAMPPCPLHNKCTPNGGLEEGIVEAVGGHLMDQEFKYLLYLIRPFVTKLTRAEDKVRVSMWIQKLASIRPCACAFMKGLRNDYMQALLGYVSLGKCPGPFSRLPPEGKLLPLAMEAKKYCQQPCLSALSREAAEEFLSNQKPLNNGAICYVAISGNSSNRKITFSPFDVDFCPYE